ncbi:MAG TPA: glycosyltransferase family 4 protein [Gammaproteobacteria bacterium]|nr:glycosyltransferase family 4 protein [Gammaproteobacteria bacterium]
MRLLFWSELFLPDIGGVEIWSAQLIHALQRRGHECLAIACRGARPARDEPIIEGIPVHRFGFHAALLGKDLAAIKKLVAEVVALKCEFRPDVIHINTSQPSVLFHEKSAAAVASATLVTVHEPPILAARNSMLARLLQDANWVVGVSQAMLDDARSLVPDIAGRSSVIYNAVNDESAALAPLDSHAPELFCVGRLVKEKGWDVAIRALKDVRAAYPNVRMAIVGDGPERSDLERLAKALGLSGAVRFTGWVLPSDVGALLESAFAVLLPARWREPFGLVALQAAEAGRPVIASRVGGLAEIVVDGVTGVLVPPNDSDALGIAIRGLLASPLTASRMGAAGRRHKRSRFGYDAFVASYEQIYRRLVGNSAGVVRA